VWIEYNTKNVIKKAEGKKEINKKVQGKRKFKEYYTETLKICVKCEKHWQNIFSTQNLKCVTIYFLFYQMPCTSFLGYLLVVQGSV
jgi:hypothetical protein